METYHNLLASGLQTFPLVELVPPISGTGLHNHLFQTLKDTNYIYIQIHILIFFKNTLIS